MKLHHFLILLILLTFNYNLRGQGVITQSQNDLFRDKAISLIKNYEAGLNNIGSPYNSNSQKEILINDIITIFFENNENRVYNDIEPEGSNDYKIRTYLNSLIIWYPSGIKFRYSIDTISKVFFDIKENYLFIKATVKEKVEGNSNKGIKISDNFIIDFYIKQNIRNKYVISNISKHEDNIDSFTPAYISDTISEKNERTSSLVDRIDSLSKEIKKLQNKNDSHIIAKSDFIEYYKMISKLEVRIDSLMNKIEKLKNLNDSSIMGRNSTLENYWTLKIQKRLDYLVTEIVKLKNTSDNSNQENNSTLEDNRISKLECKIDSLLYELKNLDKKNITNPKGNHINVKPDFKGIGKTNPIDVEKNPGKPEMVIERKEKERPKN